MDDRQQQASAAGQYMYQSIHNGRSGQQAGAERKERISAVRRTFCLLVLSDLGLVFILWVIYTQLEGDFWYTLGHQITGYDIQTSMFDMVMCSIMRFVLLILAYAVLVISHWWMVALTCLLTNCLLISKVFLFCFSRARDVDVCKYNENNNYMAFILMIATFVMSWIEVYMLDFKVLPREKRDNERLRAEAESEREPLLRSTRYTPSSAFTPSSPGEYGTPEMSDDEDDENGSISVNRLSPQDEQFLSQAEENWNYSRELLYDRIKWKQQKLGATERDPSVYTQTVPGLGKMLLLELVLDLSPQALFNEMFYGLESSPSWNPTVLEAKVLHHVDAHTDVSWSLAADAVGGAVKSRDFLTLRHWRRHGDVIISTGVSTEYSAKPLIPGIVRADNKRGTCWAFSPVPANDHACRFSWIACVNLKGWLPQAVVDTAITSTLLEYLKHLKSRVAQLNKSTA